MSLGLVESELGWEDTDDLRSTGSRISTVRSVQLIIYLPTLFIWEKARYLIMNSTTYALTFTYWILSSVLAILGNGFILLCISTSLTHDKWRLRVDRITVTFIFCLSLSDFLYGITWLIMIINDIVLLGVHDGIDIFGAPREINAPVMLINYKLLNIILNRLNVMSWTANILLILVITIHRLCVIYFPFKRLTLTHAKIIGALCIAASTLYSLYPLVIFHGFSSSSCGDRKVFLVREVCPELGPHPNPTFGDLTVHQQAGICLYSMFYLAYILMISLNLLLLFKATHYAKSKNRSKQRPIITTLCISGLFILGWTFYQGWISVMLYLRVSVEHGVTLDSARYSRVLGWLEFWGYFLYTISTWGNPVIYTLINRRFRRLVESRGTRMVRHSLSQMERWSRPLRLSLTRSLSGGVDQAGGGPGKSDKGAGFERGKRGSGSSEKGDSSDKSNSSLKKIEEDEIFEFEKERQNGTEVLRTGLTTGNVQCNYTEISGVEDLCECDQCV